MKDTYGSYALQFRLGCCGCMLVISMRGNTSWECAACGKPASLVATREANKANGIKT